MKKKLIITFLQFLSVLISLFSVTQLKIQTLAMEHDKINNTTPQLCNNNTQKDIDKLKNLNIKEIEYNVNFLVQQLNNFINDDKLSKEYTKKYVPIYSKDIKEIVKDIKAKIINANQKAINEKTIIALDNITNAIDFILINLEKEDFTNQNIIQSNKQQIKQILENICNLKYITIDECPPEHIYSLQNNNIEKEPPTEIGTLKRILAMQKKQIPPQPKQIYIDNIRQLFPIYTYITALLYFINTGKDSLKKYTTYDSFGTKTDFLENTEYLKLFFKHTNLFFERGLPLGISKIQIGNEIKNEIENKLKKISDIFYPNYKEYIQSASNYKQFILKVEKSFFENIINSFKNIKDFIEENISKNINAANDDNLKNNIEKFKNLINFFYNQASELVILSVCVDDHKITLLNFIEKIEDLSKETTKKCKETLDFINIFFKKPQNDLNKPTPKILNSIKKHFENLEKNLNILISNAEKFKKLNDPKPDNFLKSELYENICEYINLLTITDSYILRII